MTTSFFGPDKGAQSPEAGGPRYAQIAQIRSYWEALRDGAALPLRSQINPRGIEGALSHAFLIERVAIGLVRFRIAGMHLTDLMGMDVRGMPLSSMFEPAARSALAQALEQVFAAPSILEMSLEAERGLGRPALEARLLILPLASPEGEPKLALGGIVGEGQIGRSPRRFFIARRQLTPLAPPAGARLAAQQPSGAAGSGLAVPAQLAPVRGLAEGAAPFTPNLAPPPRAKAGRSHLRLVKFD